MGISTVADNKVVGVGDECNNVKCSNTRKRVSLTLAICWNRIQASNTNKSSMTFVDLWSGFVFDSYSRFQLISNV